MGRKLYPPLRGIKYIVYNNKNYSYGEHMSKSRFDQKCSEGNNVTSEQNPRFKTRRYVFTSYEKKPPPFSKKMKYLLFAPEVCPETGRDHWQGFVIYKSSRSISAVQKDGYTFGYLKKAGGDINHQLAYIKGPYEDGLKSKPFNPKWNEHGERPKGQGKRTDLDDLKNSIESGEVTVDEICMDSPISYHKYGRTLRTIEDIVARQKFRKWMTKGTWLYGPAGTSKSYTAFRRFEGGYDPKTMYIWKNDGGWQDGYTGQETVIVNEFRGDSINYRELLSMCDEVPMYVRRRGREPAPFLAKHVIITSPMSPREVFNRRAENDSLDQFDRRFNVHFMAKQCEDVGYMDRLWHGTEQNTRGAAAAQAAQWRQQRAAAATSGSTAAAAAGAATTTSGTDAAAGGAVAAAGGTVAAGNSDESPPLEQGRTVPRGKCIREAPRSSPNAVRGCKVDICGTGGDAYDYVHGLGGRLCSRLSDSLEVGHHSNILDIDSEIDSDTIETVRTNTPDEPIEASGGICVSECRGFGCRNTVEVLLKRESSSQG